MISQYNNDISNVNKNSMTEIENPDIVSINKEYAKNHTQRHNMAGFRAEKLTTYALVSSV